MWKVNAKNNTQTKYESLMEILIDEIIQNCTEPSLVDNRMPNSFDF